MVHWGNLFFATATKIMYDVRIIPCVERAWNIFSTNQKPDSNYPCYYARMQFCHELHILATSAPENETILQEAFLAKTDEEYLISSQTSEKKYSGLTIFVT